MSRASESSLLGVFRRASLLSLSLLLALSCSREKTEPTGGETHFLRRCSPDSSACGEALSCVCGVCTLPCSTDAANACSIASAAVCTPACEDPNARAHCDVPCQTDEECGSLSSAHRCEAGACRAPSAVACADDGVTANETLLIGDSFFASSHQITAYLEDLARGSGALAVGERYRDGSRLMGNALALGGNGIADQYALAREEAPAKVVIMNGGGADVLVGSCAELSPECALIADAAVAARALLGRMAEDGVLRVVYVFYPDPLDAAVRERMDVLRPLVQETCAASPVPCRFLDLRPVFEGRYGEYVRSDGLNPTSPGSEATARAVWAIMQQFCIGQ